jgi:tRNA uridine 5-carboxymethylaminomethyl modification enzyme
MIGAMSCNPAIGGLGKGHLVREVDALDGLIARAADAAAIHYRLLNRSKGPAVQGPRVQADRVRYAAAIQTMLAAQHGLDIVAGEAVALLIEQGRVAGIRLADDRVLRAPAVVLASGTFLGGRIFRGEERETGGRVGERAATALGVQLRDCGLPITRLKTGTPPRLDGRTIDWGALDEQPSDADDWRMSPMTSGPRLPPMRSSVADSTAHRCSAAQSKPAAPATAPRSRTRSSASATAMGIRFFSNRRGWRLTSSIPTAFRPRFRPMFRPR